ncbi:MAG: 3-deoxy-7-phosphoheptulonate synthase [Fusobacterium sp. JB021]|nr:3-deoxy-7-phosphoheptulonate synthase [Fusobacterium sp. JB021]MDP0506783.1 3-deoxy-7-phosphoheptulonate synthase [Fusobacterium sp. JB019]
MYLEIRDNVSRNEIETLKERIKEAGYGILEVTDLGVIKIAVIGNNDKDFKILDLDKDKIIEKAKVIDVPYRFTSRDFKKEDTIIEINGIKIGGSKFSLFAGPCSIENREMIMKIAEEVKKNGGKILRGGAFKPRTSPYDFQGLEEEGLIYMREACDKYGLLMCTEVMDTKNIENICKYADILQVGTRNMQNFSLLKELGQIDKPILLKRGMSATIKEFLMAAEYLVAYGNSKIILCERGIRTFETMTRNTVDINAIAYIRRISHLPLIIDASHGTGVKELVEPVTLAGIMAGVNGGMIEIHENPEEALSDKEQTLNFVQFESLCKKIFKTFEFRKNI